ncbi:uncharacterized protein LOC143020167 [Oratosquilla oratoria]|uniref:uncharacterized protein LOC143020167 n=1 Tax=Oratosquilla oratoria TaxID=337810 RepID=UPI003F75E1A7
MQEFYAYRLAIRGGFSPIHSGGKLFQQYIVDAYVKVEGCRLKFIPENQAQLRVAMYSGLMDHLARNNENEDPGVPVILPSSFTGSSRNMQQCYQDAMAIVCKYGRPDLFITYTCNPKCREVTENLQPHETAQNRPDLLARVFKQHLNELMIDIKDRHVLGEYKMYEQSHTVYRLALHLPDQQQVYYKPGEQRQAAARAEGQDTQLTVWFKLNQSDVDAKAQLYTDIPEYPSNTWTRRQRHRQIVTRMYSASPRNAEKFHLRMLLLHVPGATSFDDLKTVGGEQLPTFKDACIRLQLLEDDNELEMALSEAAIYQMPRQLLNMFAMICLFNTPQNALQLWNDNKHLMIEDLLCQYDNNVAENIALHRINMILNENGMNCAMLGLPEPISDPPAIQHMEEIQEVNPEVLNIEQRYVFNSVINAVSEIDRGLETNHRLFYLDAPGGSGKTFLYNMIHDYLVAQNVAVSTSAWTGIAATLLKNGKTLHSVFKLPVPLTETITCNIPPNSDQANILRQSSTCCSIGCMPKEVSNVAQFSST